MLNDNKPTEEKPTGLQPSDYAEAIQVQDACNLSGVVHSFSRMMTKIWEEARKDENKGYGTEWVNQHPIAIMFADKIAHLTARQNLHGDAVEAAWKFCEEHSK